MRVGWLGAGAMGAPMAARAARSGHAVRAYDVAPGRAAALSPDGVRHADTIAGAVTSADIVAIMVATPGQLEQVLFAPGGAADEAGAAAPLTGVARQLFARGHQLGLGRLDDSAVIEVLRQQRQPR
jgi:3-hydroxyisobutyrate dehydrogenase-like beta-hydroxyacid dehydrogenase